MTDVDRMEEGNDDSGDEMTVQSTTSAEAAALARKKRIMAMKSRMHGVDMKEEDYEESQSATKKSKVDGKTFRSYEPISTEVGNVEGRSTNLNAVEEEIKEQLRLASDTAVVHTVDLQTLAPKKVDWDLKRDITKKMEKLERRTQASIADLIRERLSEGGVDLAEAVGGINQ